MAPGIALTAMEVARIRKLRYEDCLATPEIARLVGCSESTVRHRAPGRPGKIPVAPTREIFLASGVSAAEVARRLSWLHRGAGDGNRVKRSLGINQDSSKGKRFRRTLIDAETAGLIAEACGHQRWEIEPDQAAAA